MQQRTRRILTGLALAVIFLAGYYPVARALTFLEGFIVGGALIIIWGEVIFGIPERSRRQRIDALAKHKARSAA